jgi:hypothetical protein
MNISNSLLNSINSVSHHGEESPEDGMKAYDNPKFFPESPGFVKHIGDRGSMLFLRDGYPVVYYNAKDSDVGPEYAKLSAAREMVLAGIALFEYYRETGKLPKAIAEKEYHLDEFLGNRGDKRGVPAPMLKPAIILSSLVYACLVSRGGPSVDFYELEEITMLLYVLNEKPMELGLSPGFDQKSGFSVSALYNAALDEFILALKGGEAQTNDPAMPNWTWSIGFLEDRFMQKAKKSFLSFKSENECGCPMCKMERLVAKMELLFESLDGIEIVEEKN